MHSPRRQAPGAPTTPHLRDLRGAHLAGQGAAADEAVQARRLALHTLRRQLLGGEGGVGGADRLVRLLQQGAG